MWCHRSGVSDQSATDCNNSRSCAFRVRSGCDPTQENMLNTKGSAPSRPFSVLLSAKKLFPHQLRTLARCTSGRLVDSHYPVRQAPQIPFRAGDGQPIRPQTSFYKTLVSAANYTMDSVKHFNNDTAGGCLWRGSEDSGLHSVRIMLLLSPFLTPRNGCLTFTKVLTLFLARETWPCHPFSIILAVPGHGAHGAHSARV